MELPPWATPLRSVLEHACLEVPSIQAILSFEKVVGQVAFSDKRLPVPEGVDPRIGQLMEDCFAQPAKRSSFEAILGVLRGVIKEITPQQPPGGKRRVVPTTHQQQQQQQH